MATADDLEKERIRRREEEASRKLAATVRTIKSFSRKPGPDLFTPTQIIPRIFRCWECRKNFYAPQPVSGPTDPAVCPDCGRPA